MSLFTIIGGNGFIGSEVVKQLKSKGHDVFVPDRDDIRLTTKELGIIIYCAGYGNCVNNPFKVFDSNVALLANLLENAIFDKFVYISSTRVYMGQEQTSENTDLTILSADSRRLFNLTKILAEELLLKSNENIIIIRPSNVYGVTLNSPLFLPAITRNAIIHGKVDMYVSPEYTKDYVSVIDVANITIKIATISDRNQPIYNIASGHNVSAKQIADVLQLETGCEIIWHENDTNDYFPETNIEAVIEAFDFVPEPVLNNLTKMINEFKIACLQQEKSTLIRSNNTLNVTSVY